MSTLNDISNERELKLVHDTKSGIVSVTQFDAYQNVDFTIDITTEDFVTMLKWYFYQKEKRDNLGPIQWSEEEQAHIDKIVDELKDSDSVDSLIANARNKYNEAIKKTVGSGKADEIIKSDKARSLNDFSQNTEEDKENDI